MALITGWGRGSWSEAAWDTAIPVTVSGIAGTGGIGSVSIIAEANVPTVGLQANASVTSVLVNADANVNVTGVCSNRRSRFRYCSSRNVGVNVNVTGRCKLQDHPDQLTVICRSCTVNPTGVAGTGFCRLCRKL